MKKRKGESLVEFVSNRGQPLKVDREHGIIPGVKILGLESKNDRVYLAEAVRKAIGLYEGAKVNLNHPAKATESRSYQDRIGSLKNVRFDDGLRGDLFYNPKHPLAEQLAWDAENSPENLGLSHNVEALTSRKGGRVVVEAINRVVSVDLVADPATTSSLYEAEMDPLATDVVPVDQTPADAVADGFRCAVLQILDDESLDVPAKVAGIKQLLQAQDKALAAVDPPADEPAADSTDNKDGADGAAQESVELAALRKELDGYKAKEAAASKRASIDKLVAEAKLPTEAITDVFMEQLVASDLKTVKTLIEDRVQLFKKVSVNKPKSVDWTGRVQESVEVKDAASFAKSLMG